LQQKKEQGISITCPALLLVVVQAARNVVRAEKIVKKCLLIKQKTIDITGFFGISWYNWYKGFEGTNGNAAKPLHFAPGVSLKNEFISSRH